MNNVLSQVVKDSNVVVNPDLRNTTVNICLWKEEHKPPAVVTSLKSC